MKTIDMVGQKFNKLTVLYRVYPNTSNGSARWRCICECGNECDAIGVSLRNGHKKSCGCNIRINMSKIGKQQGYNNIENLNGQKFGHLTVIDRVYDIDTHKYKCFCECDCGGQVYVSADKLKSGHTKSCGCLTSYGEELIHKYLSKNNYVYKSQITFEDLRNPMTNRKLRFDFGVFSENNSLLCLIEFNGKQHYDENSKFYTEEGVYRDQLKVEYCKNNNIPLIILTSLKDIETILENTIPKQKDIKI